jgi:tetratricopeptide (TPR) repeat protein
MRNLKFIAAVVLLSTQVFGQAPLDDAKKEIDKENYVKAKNILMPLLSQPSSAKEAAYYLGNAYLLNDDKDSAKVFYRQVGGADNKTPIGYLANGRLALLNGDLAGAKKLFDMAAVKSGMKNATILYQAGDALFRPSASDLTAAISYFEDAYKLDNRNYVNMLELGDAYQANNDGGKALSKYESAAELYPNLTLAYIKIGRLNVAGRIYDDAITAYKKAIAIEPDYAVAHEGLAEAYYRATKFDLAKPEFKRYIELNKEDADAKIRFLVFLFQLKQYEQCVTEAQVMLNDDPSNYQILRILFYSQYELKRYKEGLDVAQKFWVAVPQAKVKPYDYIETARLSAKGGDTATALKYFSTALSIDTNNDELLGDYANLMYTTKRYSESIANYTKKITKFPYKAGYYDYYYIGRANYFIALGFRSQKDNAPAQDSANVYLTAADTAFAQLTNSWPTSADGWQWRAKANTYLDPEMKSGAAVPYYEQFVKLAEATTDPALQTRFKSFLLDSYQYMGEYYLNSKEYPAAKEWLDKAHKLDPFDQTTLELEKALPKDK